MTLIPRFSPWLLLFAFSAPAQELVNPVGVLGVSLERPVFDSSAYARVGERVHAGQKKVRPFGTLYYLNDGIDAQYAFRLALDSVHVRQGHSTAVVHEGRLQRWEYAHPGTVYFYGVTVGRLASFGPGRDVSDFLTNAYLLETGAIRLDSAQVMRTPLKSDAEFWRRNLISQGLGAQYIYANNPYGNGGWLPIGFGYLIDAATLAVAVALPFTGDRLADRIGAPLIMIGFSMALKVGLNGFVAKGHMNTYNRFVRSGYPIPKTSGWDFRKARFGHYPDSGIVVKVTPTPTAGTSAR